MMVTYRYFPITRKFVVVDTPLSVYGYPGILSGSGQEVFVTRFGNYAYGPAFVAIFTGVNIHPDCGRRKVTGSGKLIDSFTQVALGNRQVLIVNGRTREVLASLLTDLQGRFSFSNVSFGGADIVQAVFQGDGRFGPGFSKQFATCAFRR